MPTATATDPPQPTVPPAQDTSVATLQCMQRANAAVELVRVLTLPASGQSTGTNPAGRNYLDKQLRENARGAGLLGAGARWALA